jgi:UDP-glucose 4-epimerase
MNIIVTGGAGFIGSNIADALLAEGHRVSIIDNLSTGKKRNIPEDAEFYELDIASPKIDQVFERGKFDIMFHLAAQMDVRKSVENPANDALINIIGGINLLQASLKHKVKRVIFSSTGGAIYGEQDEFPASENHAANPVSPYGISKLAFEKYLFFYNCQHGLSYVALRYANVYGPRQNSEGEAGVVAIFCKKLLAGEKAVIYGDGGQTRDFVFVEDVVRANLLAMKYEGSAAFNVGTGIETDINTVFEQIRNCARSNQQRINLEPKPGEQRRSVISYDKIKKVMGWSPNVNFGEGIAKTVSYFRSEAGKAN